MLTEVLGSALDGALVCRAVRDRRGRIVDFECLAVDEGAGRLAGRDPSELVGKRLRDHFAFDDDEPFARFAEVAETGRRTAFVHRRRTLDGRDRWFRSVAAKVGDDRLAATFLDVTELEATERAAAATAAEGRDAGPRASPSLYRGIFEHLPIGLFLIDAASQGGPVVEALNPAAAALLGVGAAAASDAVGRAVEAVFPPAIAADLVEHIRACVMQGRAAEYEFTGALPGLGRRSLGIGLAPIRDEAAGGGGAVTRVIGRLLDVTERKQAEEALVHAQKMEAIGQLTGGVAHDFNNLLTVIGGNLELLEYQLGDQPARLALIRKALDGVFRAATLTQQLLAYSRKQRLNPEIVDVNRVVEGLHAMLERTLGETIEIKLSTREGLWPCEVDRGALETVVLNLAVNARDAMPDGGTLTIETDNLALDDAAAARLPGVRAGSYVTLTVTDTGQGIPAHLLGHVFEPFFTTKEVGKGSGLGLSMAYGFARQSGGHIAIYSDPGAGTTLRLYLPRAATDGERAPPPGADDQAARGPATILVVEDDPEVRRLAADRLTGLGYRVIEAADGRGALAALDEHPEIDLLFTDLVMPGGVDGATLAARARERRAGLKVLFTTGYTDRATPPEASDGRAQLLAKPYRLADLAHKVRAALGEP